MTKHKKITNDHFNKFKNVINTCIGSNMNGTSIISNMRDASLDDKDKSNMIYLYDGLMIDMDTIKLDEITKHRICMIPNTHSFQQLCAVDAICINSQNEWFFIEFKNSDIKEKKATRNSIRKKMIESIWYVFFMYSKAGEDLTQIFSGDITKFARENITYIIVGSQSKNILYHSNIQAAESSGTHYTPPGFESFIGYYFKNVYMLTEKELRDFILNFKT